MTRLSQVDLGQAIAATDPARLLPGRRADENAQMAGPAKLVMASALPGRDQCWAAVIQDGAGALFGAPVVATGGAAGEQVRRAVAGDGAAQALLTALATGPATLAPNFRAVSLNSVQRCGEVGIDVDQTHDSVVVGDPSGPDSAVVVKWAVDVHSQPGPPAAVAAMRHLHATGFTATPQPVGFLIADVERGNQALLASATTWLTGARDGWEFLVRDVLDCVQAPVDSASRQAAVATVRDIALLVAGMHGAFASRWSGCPEPVGVASVPDVRRWHAQARRTLAQALRLTTGPAGDRLRKRTGLANQAVDAGFARAAGTPVTRVHGDLHVGQVLRWDGGYAVSDFDGNPVLPPAERAAPQPPARDVAGLLCSLDHVAAIADRRTGGTHAGRLRQWAATARTTFLDTYRGARADVADVDLLLDPQLLFAFQVEQECRELVYAARHLARWTYAPDAALAALLPVHGDPDPP